MAKERNRQSNPRKNSGASLKGLVLFAIALIIAIQVFLLIKKHAPARPPKPPRRVAVIKKQKPPQARPAIVQGKIAIIIDDNGYNSRDCDFLRAVKGPVAVSVLPDLEFSRDMATCAHENGKEVILHLPLEAHDSKEHYPKDYILTTAMPPATIAQKLDAALASVPFASGVNNHMGSKATESARFMSYLFQGMKTRGLFFVDSRVTGRSVSRLSARRQHVPFAQRDVFLDNINTRPYIENQFLELERKANEQGSAIGIGHARPLTWEILAEEIERLRQKGFQIVTVKETLDDPE